MRRLLWLIPILCILSLAQGIGGKAGIGAGIGGGASAGGPIATDNFNRANEAPIAGNWTTCSGGAALNLTSNQLAAVSTGADGCIYYNAVTPNNDQYAQAVIAIGTDTTAGDGSGFCVTIRNSTGANTHYEACVQAAATLNVSLAKRVAGAYTSIWTRTNTFNNLDTLKVSATGTTIRVYRNGVQVGTDSTDSSVTSGRCGAAYSSSDSGANLDNWECGNN